MTVDAAVGVAIGVIISVTISVPVGFPIGLRSTVGRRGRSGPLRLGVSNVLPRHPSAHDRIPVKKGCAKFFLMPIAWWWMSW
jgi:hypothetical protein